MGPVAVELGHGAVVVRGINTPLCLEEKGVVDNIIVVPPIDQYGVADHESGEQMFRIVDGSLRMGKRASESDGQRRTRHVEWFVFERKGIIRSHRKKWAVNDKYCNPV